MNSGGAKFGKMNDLYFLLHLIPIEDRKAFVDKLSSAAVAKIKTLNDFDRDDLIDDLKFFAKQAEVKSAFCPTEPEEAEKVSF